MFLILIISSLFANTDSQQIYDDFNLLYNDFLIRDEGSLNEKRLIDYLEKFCQIYNLNYTITKIDNQKDIVTNSYNIEIILKGSSKENDQIVFFCPLNSPIINQSFYDNSLSIQVMLDLIKKLNNISFKKDVIFLFSGANEGEYDKYNGIKYFLENRENVSKTLIVVVDILSNKNKIRFSGSNEKNSIPLELLKKFLKLQKGNKNIYFNRNEIFRTRILAQTSDNYLNEFLKNETVAVSFSNRENIKDIKIKAEKEYQVQLTDFFYNFFLSFDNIIFPLDSDYNYLYLNFFNIRIIISETTQIILYLLLIFIAIVLRMFFPKFQRIHYRSIINLFPYIMTLFSLFFLFSLIPLFLFFIIEKIFHIYRLYSNSIIIYMINIFLIPFVLIITFFNYVKMWSFPKHSYLYTYGFMISCFLNMVIILLLDISLIMIYLLPLILITLNQYLKKILWVRIIFHFLIFMPFLILIFDLTYLNNQFFLNNINPILFNLFFSISCFPFILIILEVYVRFINHIHINKKIIFSSVVLVILLSSVFLVLNEKEKFKKENILSVKLITNVKENFSYLKLKSNYNIGEFFLNHRYAKKKYAINDKQFNIPIQSVKPYYTINTNQYNDFTYIFKIKSDHILEYLNIYLVCPKEFYPLESNYRYNKVDQINLKDYNLSGFNTEENDFYSFAIGRNAGEEFEFKIHLLKGNYKIFINIEFPFIDYNFIDINNKSGFINKRSSFLEQINL
ncbi:MAG: hypothetical protein JXB50_01985 [Spirochaetes bacterium]|nr:hypothetical protein [Spirochaetota bacterium]